MNARAKTVHRTPRRSSPKVSTSKTAAKVGVRSTGSAAASEKAKRTLKKQEYTLLAAVVARYRAKMKLSLEELSQISGISLRELDSLETGAAALSLEKLYRISNYLNIPPSVLLTAIHD